MRDKIPASVRPSSDKPQLQAINAARGKPLTPEESRKVAQYFLSKPSQDFEERRDRYLEMDALAKNAGVDTVWFRAAADLNETLARNELGLFATGSDSFLNRLGDDLYAHNVTTLTEILSGQITEQGSALDDFLVSKEQNLAQSFIDFYYPGDIPPDVRADVNNGFKYGNWRMPTKLKDAVRKTMSQLSGHFDYFFLPNRILLGRFLMAEYRGIPS